MNKEELTMLKKLEPEDRISSCMSIIISTLLEAKMEPELVKEVFDYAYNHYRCQYQSLLNLREYLEKKEQT